MPEARARSRERGVGEEEVHAIARITRSRMTLNIGRVVPVQKYQRLS